MGSYNDIHDSHTKPLYNNAWQCNMASFKKSQIKRLPNFFSRYTVLEVTQTTKDVYEKQ